MYHETHATVSRDGFNFQKRRKSKGKVNPANDTGEENTKAEHQKTVVNSKQASAAPAPALAPTPETKTVDVPPTTESAPKQAHKPKTKPSAAPAEPEVIQKNPENDRLREQLLELQNQIAMCAWHVFYC